eukprot:43467_1
MGSPLNKGEMLALIILTGCSAGDNFRACHRKNVYTIWKWLDHCAYNAIKKLSSRETGHYMVYAGLKAVNMSVIEVNNIYLPSYICTSWKRDVAICFGDGYTSMLMEFDSRNGICCDVSWISKFTGAEQEILFARSICDENEFNLKVIDTQNEAQIVSVTYNSKIEMKDDNKDEFKQIEADEISFFAFCNDYGTHSLKYSSNTKIKVIKDKFASLYNSSIPSTLITYKERQCENEKSLQDYDITDSSIIYVNVCDPNKSLKITIKPLDTSIYAESHALNLVCTRTVDDIVNQLKRVTSRYVICIKRSNAVLQRNRTLIELAISNNDVLYAEYRPQQNEGDQNPQAKKSIFEKIFSNPKQNPIPIEMPLESSAIGEPDDDGKIRPNRNGCFLANTRILMANGETQLINDVKKGDKILIDKQGSIGTVAGNYRFITDKHAEITLSNGSIIQCTLDHPLCVVDKGLCAVEYNEYINKLCEGDILATINEAQSVYVMQISIHHTTNMYCYTLDLEGDQHYFYVENVKTHNGFMIYLNYNDGQNIIPMNIKPTDCIGDIANHFNMSYCNLIDMNCRQKIIQNDTNYISSDSMIFTNKGLKQIGDISVGDAVFCCNFQNYSMEIQTVEKIFTFRHFQCVKLSFSDNTIIHCSASQLFYSPNHENWCSLKSGDLIIGSYVYKFNISKMIMECVQLIHFEFLTAANDSAFVMMNIHVSNQHNYIANELIMHNTMQIFVKLLNSKRQILDVEPNDTIHRVKEKIHSEFGIPVDSQTLHFGKVELQNINDRLSECKIYKQSTIYIKPSRKIYCSNILQKMFIPDTIETFGRLRKYCSKTLKIVLENTNIVIDKCAQLENDNTKLDTLNWWKCYKPIHVEDSERPFYDTRNYPLNILSSTKNSVEQVMINKDWNLDMVREMLTEEIPHLLYNGRYLHDKKPLSQYKIGQKDCVVSLPSNKGGSILKFNSWLRYEDEYDVKNNESKLEDVIDLKELYGSLCQTVDPQNVKYALIKGLKHIKWFQKKYKKYAHIPREALLAIYLWTTDLCYAQINKGLRNKHNLKELEQWKPFLHFFDCGLRQMPYVFAKKVYRGIGYKGLDLCGYAKGKTLCWRDVTACSLNKDVAMVFMMDNARPRVLFEMESIDGRHISKLSQFKNEEEVLFLPFCCFRVMDTKLIQPGTNMEYLYVILKQIKIPRTPKVIVWVDDKPQNNLQWIFDLERKGISVVICTSTKEAIIMLETYKWMLLLKHAEIRIVTDMDRYGNKIAGIELIQILRNVHKFDHKILIFTGHEKPVRKSCIEYKVTENVYVATEEDVIEKYIAFQDIDEIYGFNDH